MATTDRTNYQLLSIVGIVALTAIIAMYVHAEKTPSPSLSPRITLVDGSTAGAAITANVIADGVTTRPASRAYRTPDFDWSRYDYDNNGVLDQPDTIILADVIDRKRFCPVEKLCDVNDDGSIDLQDLGLFNAKLLKLALERQSVQQASSSALTGNVIGSNTPAIDASGDDFWVAVTGVPVQ